MRTAAAAGKDTPSPCRFALLESAVAPSEWTATATALAALTAGTADGWPHLTSLGGIGDRSNGVITVTGGSVTIGGPSEVAAPELSGGLLTGAGHLTLTGAST